MWANFVIISSQETRQSGLSCKRTVVIALEFSVMSVLLSRKETRKVILRGLQEEGVIGFVCFSFSPKSISVDYCHTNHPNLPMLTHSYPNDSLYKDWYKVPKPKWLKQKIFFSLKMCLLGGFWRFFMISHKKEVHLWKKEKKILIKNLSFSYFEECQLHQNSEFYAWDNFKTFLQTFSSLGIYDDASSQKDDW